MLISQSICPLDAPTSAGVDFGSRPESPLLNGLSTNSSSVTTRSSILISYNEHCE